MEKLNTQKNRNIPPTQIKLFIFDMDGVIFERKNFWFDLHKEYGNLKEALSYYRNSKHSQKKYTIIFELMVMKYWKGIKCDGYKKLIAKRKYSNNIFELIQYLKQKKIKTAIISSGPYRLAQRAKYELGIDYIYANKLEIKDNYFTGKYKLVIDNDDKSIVLKKLLTNLRIKKNEVAFIGDSNADVIISKIIEFSFSYNSNSEELLKCSKYNLAKNELVKIMDILSKK